MSVIHIIGLVLCACGACLWIVSFRQERLRHRILHEEPQAAPKRVQPEFHALVTLITAGGVVMLAGWSAGGVALITQAVLACLVFGIMLDRWG